MTALSRGRAAAGPLALVALVALVALLLAGCAAPDVADPGTEGGQRPGIAETGGPDGEPDRGPATTASDDATASTGATDPETATSDPSGSDSELVDDLPLGSGWPAEADADQPGLQLPVDSLDRAFVDGAYEPSTCALDAPDRATSAELRAQFTDSDRYLSRDLRVFARADDAVSYVTELADYYASCRTVVLNGTTRQLLRVDPGAGGQSFALVLGSVYGREPGIGTDALLAVRVGRSVLVDTSVDDALVEDRADARALTASMVDRAGDVLAAQCVFTAAGC